MTKVEVRDIINSSRNHSILHDGLESISALALDGDLPHAFLDLPESPTDDDISSLWRSLDVQASIQRGERQVQRRGPIQIKSLLESDH